MNDMADTPQPPSMLRSRRRGEVDTEKVRALVQTLQSEADDRVRLRSVTETRWIEDLWQFHGQYSEKIVTQIKKRKRSELFINLTRPKTNALIAKLVDLLFPTDDRHWGIGPTPVPEMDEAEDQANKQITTAKADMDTATENFAKVSQNEDLTPGAEASPELMEAGQAQDAAEEQVSALQEAIDHLAELREEARKKSDLMQEEIDDQLKASRYQAQCRDAIEDACRLGTGIIKGPILGEQTHPRWKKQESEYQLQDTTDLRPSFKRVDPWSFFPDPYARTPEEAEGFFERHLMNKKQLRKLARREDMDKDAIRDLLKGDPDSKAPANMPQLFAITDDQSHNIKGKYQVWEYSGPIEPEDLMTLIDVYEDFETADAMQEIDPIKEIHAKVWFCQSEVLSFSLHPMDSGEPIYSIFNIEKSETSMFGYGIPRIMRDPQAAVNGAWRAMMDNAALAAGPQIVISNDKIQRADGSNSNELEAFGLWIAKDGNGNTPPFQVFHIEMNQQLLQNIIDMGRQAIDEVTGLPMSSQGEPGAMPQQTATGWSIITNNANVGIRRIVKNWDDDVTVPNIRRAYDFNMQFSEKEEIKGDYEVDARGSSVLLVREVQAPNLVNMAQTFTENPRYEDRIAPGNLLKEIFKAHSIPTDGILLSEREYKKAMEEKAQNQTPDPMVELKKQELEAKHEEVQARTAIAEMESDARLKVAQLNFDAAMSKIASDANSRDDESENRSNDNQADRELKERNLAIEVAMRERTGKSAGGSV